MSSRRWLCRLCTASALAIVSVACSDYLPDEPESSAKEPPAALVVSDPFSSAQAVSAGPTLVSAVDGEVAYVSLPAGSLPEAMNVTIRNITSGAAQTPSIPILDGGFDPVPVGARAGDELELRIAYPAGAIDLHRAFVPIRRPPRVVRTNPPKGKTDVAVNLRVTVVFTEPIAPVTLTTATVQLLHGTTPVPGTVRLVAGSLFEAEFVPDEEMAGGTTYRLVVTRGIRDADGDSLEADVAADFTTLGFSPFTSIVAGMLHTCALRADGNVLCWGENVAGQLGAGNNVRAFGGCPWENIPTGYNPFPCSIAPVTVAGGHTFTSLTSGAYHSCALTAAGEALCWGTDHNSELGAGITVWCNPDYPGPGSTPWQCSGVPLRFADNLGFASIAAGGEHTCGIRIGGAAYCWGQGSAGALGIGDAGITDWPAAVLGGIAFKSLALGAYHTCGLTGSGAAYCWGNNQEGQLGNGGASPDTCIYPVSSEFPAPTGFACAKAPVLVSGGLTFTSLTAGWSHTCGLTPSGRAYCWGGYRTGSEGWSFVGAGSYGAVPAPVNNDLAFVSLSSGSSSEHTCGVTSANVAYCWGNNSSELGQGGQLGDGSKTSSLAPVPVTGGLAFSAVTVGYFHSCGITTEAILYCWGHNVSGQLGAGRNASVESLQPIRVAGQ